MKKFLMAFLGALAAIWLSAFIAFFGFFIVIGVIVAAGSGSATSTTEVKKHSYLTVNLEGEISDRPGSIDVMGIIRGEDTEQQGLNEMTSAIRSAAKDDKIDGIVIECKGSVAGLAQRQALVEALADFKADAPDKWIYAYGNYYEQGDYYVAASTADSLFLNPVGAVDIHGLSSTTLYFKDLLDKMGVDVQVVKVGTYKSAVEPFLLNGMSDASREQQQLFLNNIWADVAASIAKGRRVSVDSVNTWADGFVFADAQTNLVKMKIVDRLIYRHEFDERLMALTSRDKLKDLTPVTTSEYYAANPQKAKSKASKIGVLYACGDITDETGDGIVAKKLVPEILKLADEDKLDGLVVYVNSGGGSAFASEQIWEALQQWKQITGKPLYVSMSDYAASGGYYISCGADKIFAQPTTITGSIGIFGMIPNAQKLLTDKLGIHTGTVKTNASGNFPSIFSSMTPAEQAAMQANVERGYDLFTRRCAEGRHMSQDSIKAIAEGRVWDGTEALRIGLVDELGGLDAAIKALAEELNVETWTVEEYPKRKTKWYDPLLQAGAGLEDAIVDHRLGELAPIYRTIERAALITPVQARMPMIEVNL